MTIPVLLSAVTQPGGPGPDPGGESIPASEVPASFCDELQQARERQTVPSRPAGPGGAGAAADEEPPAVTSDDGQADTQAETTSLAALAHAAAVRPLFPIPDAAQSEDGPIGPTGADACEVCSREGPGRSVPSQLGTNGGGEPDPSRPFSSPQDGAVEASDYQQAKQGALPDQKQQGNIAAKPATAPAAMPPALTPSASGSESGAEPPDVAGGVATSDTTAASERSFPMRATLRVEAAASAVEGVDASTGRGESSVSDPISEAVLESYQEPASSDRGGFEDRSSHEDGWARPQGAAYESPAPGSAVSMNSSADAGFTSALRHADGSTAMPPIRGSIDAPSRIVETGPPVFRLDVAQGDGAPVQVHVSLVNQTVYARVVTSHVEVQEFLAQNQARLEASLQQHGLAIGQFLIDSGQQHSGGSPYEWGARREGGTAAGGAESSDPHHEGPAGPDPIGRYRLNVIA